MSADASPRPTWTVAMRWSHLLFAHWPVPVDALRPHVPPMLALDTFDGDAWLAVVPFTMPVVRPRLTPPLGFGPGAFHELNVRTYVTYRGEPGVWFFSLDASSPTGVAAGRASMRLAYLRARMSLTESGGTVRYASERTDRRARGRVPGHLRADGSRADHGTGDARALPHRAVPALHERPGAPCPAPPVGRRRRARAVAPGAGRVRDHDEHHDAAARRRRRGTCASAARGPDARGAREPAPPGGLSRTRTIVSGAAGAAGLRWAVPTTLSAVTMNSADPQRTAAFWAALLGGTCHDGGNGYVHVRGGPLLLVVQRAPARDAAHAIDVHLDLTADDRPREVARAVALGASVVDERCDSHGAWTVLRDPDGREFCLA